MRTRSDTFWAMVIVGVGGVGLIVATVGNSVGSNGLRLLGLGLALPMFLSIAILMFILIPFLLFVNVKNWLKARISKG